MTCIDVTMPTLAPNRSMVLVAAAALIDAQNNVLLAQRPQGKSMAGLWEFPGGKVEAGEIPEAALVRELREELGIETSVGCFWPLTFASYPYPDFHLLMPVYGCRVWAGTPRPCEGQGLVWVPKAEWKNYETPPADVSIMQILWELL